MASVSAVLGTVQGPYEYGVRDCLITALALATDAVGPSRAAPYREWVADRHAMSEREAWKLTIWEGGELAVACRVLAGIAERVDDMAPGDLIFIDQPMVTRNNHRLGARPGREIGAFCDESFELLYWTTTGLSTIVNAPRRAAVLRFA